MPNARLCLLFVLGVLACGSKEEPTDGDDDPSTPTPTDPIPPERLDDGVYTGAIEALEDNTCGEMFLYRGGPAPSVAGQLVILGAGFPTIRNTGADAFDLDFGGLVLPCEVTSSGVACDGYSAPIGAITLESTIGELVIEEPTRFRLREELTFDCSGTGCEEYEASFPCRVDAVSTYLLPVDESAWCFDGFDNDQDGGADHLDADCPAFTPLVWSVDGEFGYDAVAGGAVPYLLDGVLHPPALHVRITAGVWTDTGFASPSSDPDQQCTLTLTATGSDPIPLTLETMELGYGTPYPESVTHHTLRLPAGGFAVTTDCEDKGLLETASFGSLDDIANTPWAVGVGEPVFESDLYGGSRHVGIESGLAVQGAAAAWAVDAAMNVTNTSGGVATAADVSADALQPIDPGVVSGQQPLPSGAYVVTPWPAGVGLYLGD